MSDVGTWSVIVGWTYFTAWALSSYPQIILNYRRKSVVGLSFDFMSFSFTGNLCYAVFNVVLFCKDCPEKMNDVISSIHAVFLSSTLVIQCMMYEKGGQTVAPLTRLMVALLWVSVFFNAFLYGLGYIRDWKWCIHYLGYIKDFCSFVKYTPQAYLNYKRGSTQGFNILGICLDFTGGSFSFLQMVLDGIDQGNWSEMYGDIPKLVLAFESIAFDFLFFGQHFCCFGDRPPKRLQHYSDSEDDMEMDTESRYIDTKANGDPRGEHAPLLLVNKAA
eukprot:GFYU01003192.1.p1 GENE.GFYU01003192.1~~GFYU01003192.1.p1  ORF type:complete len:284 (-),score=42.91 GFYU01003192.1:21-845(-)